MSKKLIQAAAGAGGESVYVEDVFSTYLYTGTGSAQTITNGIDLAGEGGLVWIKNRDTVDDNVMFSPTFGPSKMQRITTAALETVGTDVFQSFNSDGFTHGGWGGVGGNGNDIVSWTFRKQAGFFDVVTWSGDGTTNRQISHNLGSVPGCIIVKRYDSSDDWKVYHVGADATAPEDYVLELNATGARLDSISAWNDTAPTKNNFTVNSGGSWNASGGTYVAYLFATGTDSDSQIFGDNADESIIKCGSFTASTGTEVNLGFEPQWIIAKSATSSTDWYMFDTMRGWGADRGSNDAWLYANTSGAEFNNTNSLGLTPTGFISFNGGGETYIYIAIRRPMKTPESGTEVFALETIGATNGGSLPSYVSGFPVDMLIQARRDVDNNMLITRLLGETRLFTNLSNSESSETDADFDYQDGAFSNTSVDTNRLGYMFKRATGFFDVVTYYGTGSATTQTHNLGVIPEMIIVKRRSSIEDWLVYHSATGNQAGTGLNETNATYTGVSQYWNSTSPTDTVFSLGTHGRTNTSSETYIAYLFATLAGVSKVGSYTGTGSNVDVDCGFSAGARFILIKRTSGAGDWYVYDSERGIVAGNDPYLLINSTAAEVTNTDYIDPLSSGFTVTSSGGNELNDNGSTYIFLAIA